MKKILVTGAAGFIGRVVVNKLLTEGLEVVAMLRPGSIPPFDPHERLELLYADIAKYDSFAAQVRGVEAIVHLAANKYHPKLSYVVNLQGAENIVRLIKEKRMKGKRVINISSQSTKIRFRGAYGESKRQSDEILSAGGLELTTLKPSLVYGPGEGTLFATIKNYTEKLPVVPLIGNGKWELYPIDVEDLATAIVSCLREPQTIGKIYDLGDTKKITFDGLIKLIQKELKVKKEILHVPVWIGLPAVWLATKLIPNLPFNTDNVLGSNQNTHCDARVATKQLGLKVLPIAAGVKKYLGAKESERLRVAVVGLGKMGILHASILSTIPETEVVAIVDMDRALGSTALSMGIKAKFFESLSEAIKNVSFEAVYICTPTFAHEEVIKVCEAHSLPYFVEKPVFPSYASFDNIQVNAKNMAGYFWIYKRETQYAKELIESKVIGQVVEYRVRLEHGEVFGPKKGWMFKKKLSGGGVLANPGPHALSLVTYLFGKGQVTQSQVEYLYGNEVEDKVTLHVDHKQVSGEIVANWSVKNKPIMTIEFEITGTEGKITFTNDQLVITTKGKTQKLNYEQIPHEKVFDLNPKSGGDAYFLETKAFIDAIRDNKRFANTVQFARHVESLMNEAYEKAK